MKHLKRLFDEYIYKENIETDFQTISDMVNDGLLPFTDKGYEVSHRFLEKDGPDEYNSGTYLEIKVFKDIKNSFKINSYHPNININEFNKSVDSALEKSTYIYTNIKSLVDKLLTLGKFVNYEDFINYGGGYILVEIKLKD